MSTSRDKILKSLHGARRPFQDALAAPEAYIPMVPIEERDAASLKARFITEAEKLSCIIHQESSPSAAIETILEIVDGDASIMSWDDEQLPLPKLAETLQKAGVAVGAPRDPDIRVGVSGADAALAATGSLVITSGAGKYRTASLLPPVHVAVITAGQILPDLESWINAQSRDNLETLRQSSNAVVVSGPSRTADIAMQLILGMHGPGKMHIIIIDQ